MSAATLSELQHRADAGFAGAGGDLYEALAAVSHSEGLRKADARYFVLSECFQFSADCWSTGEGGAVSSDLAGALAATWDHHLASVLGETDAEAAVALATTLRDDLRSLAA